MKLVTCFLVVLVGVCSAALADEPQAPTPQPPAAQAPAPNTPASASEVKPAPGTAAAPGAPKAEKTELASAGPTEAEIKQMRGRGYKPVNRNGTLVFCRDEGELGTHFQRTRCSTLDQLKQAELSGKEYVNSIQQQGGPVQNKP
jgi:hypothetical protein